MENKTAEYEFTIVVPVYNEEGNMSRLEEAFLLSLPIAGIDGGLAGYCYSFPDLKDRLRAKTGSMSGVRCLSGYLTCFDGERLAFTVLINHYTCSVSQLQKAIGKFLSAFL